MSLSQETLVEAIQSTFHIWADAAPVFDRLEIPGLKGQIGPTSYPPLNVVGMARLDEATADAVIRQVIERFAAEGKAFAWVVGPSSTPADLGTRLQAAGLQNAEEFSGMALTALTKQIPVNPAIRIKIASFEEMRTEAKMMASAFGFIGMTEADAIAWVDAFEAVQDRYYNRWYLAFTDNRAAPVGFSFMTNTDVPAVVYLPGAATLKQYRGMGIYKSLVSRRVADAHADGAQAAVTQAVRRTSAPILQRIGFKVYCSLEAYVWMPDGS